MFFIFSTDSCQEFFNRQYTPTSIYALPVASLKLSDPFNGEHDHFQNRPSGDLGKVRALVLHYTVCNFEQTLKLFTTSAGQVSAHYVVSEKEERVAPGRIFNIVPETKRAQHAGISAWGDIQCDTTNDGTSRGLNSASIGIEFVNKGFVDHSAVRQWFPFDPTQIEHGFSLIKGIVDKYNIFPKNVVAHADIAPNRKQDPGVLFPWEKLYRKGIGAWLTPEELTEGKGLILKESLPQGVSEAFVLKCLEKYGYRVQGSAYMTPELAESILYAFRMHFSANQHPEKLTGPITQDDQKWAAYLCAKYCSDKEQ